MHKMILILTLLTLNAPARANGPIPVSPAKDQGALRRSPDPKLAFNKRLAYDFFRIILTGRHLDQTSSFMSKGYIQHNPNVDTGRDAFIQYFSRLGGPRAIPADLEGLVSIQAEGDLVTLSFVNEVAAKPAGVKYTTTWFDMFCIRNGKIVEHWDCALKDY